MTYLKFNFGFYFAITLITNILFNPTHSYASNYTDLDPESDPISYNHITDVLDLLNSEYNPSWGIRLEIPTDENLEYYKESLHSYYATHHNTMEDVIDRFIFLAFDICDLNDGLSESTHSNILFNSLSHIAIERGNHENSSALAQYNLGLLYFKDYDYKKAKKYFELASHNEANEGNFYGIMTRSEYRLGCIYFKKYEEEESNKRRKKYFEISHEYLSTSRSSGSADSAKFLASHYNNSHNCSSRIYSCLDPMRTLFASEDIYTQKGIFERAEEYYGRLSASGNPYAHLQLGLMGSYHEKSYNSSLEPLRNFWFAALGGVLHKELKNYLVRCTLPRLSDNISSFNKQFESFDADYGNLLSRLYFQGPRHGGSFKGQGSQPIKIKSLVKPYNFVSDYLHEFGLLKDNIAKKLDDPFFMNTNIKANNQLKNIIKKDSHNGFLKHYEINSIQYLCIGKDNIDLSNSIIQFLKQKRKALQKLGEIQAGLRASRDLLKEAYEKNVYSSRRRYEKSTHSHRWSKSKKAKSLQRKHKKKMNQVRNELKIVKKTRDFIKVNTNTYINSLLEFHIEERHDTFEKQYSEILKDME